MKEDNFGDHRLTETGRVDATARAPFDMGMGSRKKIFLKCECGRVVEVKKSTVRIKCGECGKEIEVDKAKRVGIEEAYEKTKVMLSSEYLKFRKQSEEKAENYRLGKK